MIVLNFHYVEQNILHPTRKCITITPGGLRAVIKTLRFMGYRIVSMPEVLAMNNPGLDTDNLALITFDDGYENNLTEALPVLEEEQCPATVFVLPGRFDGTNAWDQGHLPEKDRDQLLSLAQMHTLANSPFITLGSHGMTHVKMDQVSEAELRDELFLSHQILSETFGQHYAPVLAYPWGNHNQAVVDLMAETPYKYAFTVETAPWKAGIHPFMVPRYSAFYRDGNPFIFIAKLMRHNLVFR
ncbi:MAG: polysaccharide deacetylase family protein [Cyanobacteria bacterium P01_H01_bin.74]